MAPCRRNPKGTGGLRPGTAAIAVVAASELLPDTSASRSSSFLVWHPQEGTAAKQWSCAAAPRSPDRLLVFRKELSTIADRTHVEHEGQRPSRRILLQGLELAVEDTAAAI